MSRAAHASAAAMAPLPLGGVARRKGGRCLCRRSVASEKSGAVASGQRSVAGVSYEWLVASG